ncbi:MAG: hypothetical protein LBV74_19915 [Tannerella sp.]|nr:hypothetical protein [Tannerella sp.]
MKKEEIIENLKEITGKKNVSLPSSIDFEIEKNVLAITMTEKGLRANMQCNKSAFDGWAFCLKAWLPELIKEVSICWNPLKRNEYSHYERFLYRVEKFTEAYDWARNGSLFDLKMYKGEQERDKNWVANFPCGDATEDVEGKEAILERNFINNHSIDYDVINQQLPVGVFNIIVSKESCIMPRGKSQIDIWAIKGNTLHVFELKNTNNTMVGIISELMYYVNIMNDIKNKQIAYPKDAEKSKYRDFDALYSAFKEEKIKHIEGHFLAKKLHPLISSNVIDLINDSHLLKMNHMTYSHIAL